MRLAEFNQRQAIDTSAINQVEQTIKQFLSSLSQGAQLWLAYSGGIDSHVLLHALASLNIQQQLSIVHVNHHLNRSSEQWAQHCQQVCQQLSLPITIKQVNAEASKGESPEAAARQARYQCLRALLNDGDYLLTAHHQHDQAETFLLQLLRGAGLKGLSAMATVSDWRGAYLARPLLSLNQQVIIDYAKAHSLQWAEDSSNNDLSLDRNFIRHRVMPLLQQRRAGAYKTLSRSASHCAEADQLAMALAEIDLTAVQQDTISLSVSQLKKLPDIRQRNLIRYWLQQRSLPLPSEIKLKHILRDAIYSHFEAKPCVIWGGVVLKRQKDRLWLACEQSVPSS